MINKKVFSLNKIREILAPLAGFLLLCITIVGKVFDAMDLNKLGLSGDWWLVIFLVFCLVYFSYLFYRYRLSTKPQTLSGNKVGKDTTKISSGIEFYPDRSAVAEKYHGLQNELKGASSAWVSWASGAYYNMIADDVRAKITQMIIVNPDSELLKELAKGDNRSHSELVIEINKAVGTAKTKNTQIAYSNKPILYCIIGDPHTDNAWARLQIYLPNMESPQWPNIIVRKKDNGIVFERIKKAYEKLFKELPKG
jgi:hypothetical protein